MAASAATMAYIRSVMHEEVATSGSYLYLTLGAMIGIGYSLGTEWYIRAMQHRHIFVRTSMLWLSAITWLFAALAVGFVASRIYRQSGGGLEGYDRVLGILIPFVVRADLVVDWARRVAWALLNMENWTMGAVQLGRIMGRGEEMYSVVQMNVRKFSYVREGDLQRQLEKGEESVWEEDRDSLTRGSDVWQHFQKLGRVALYALFGLLLAVPGGVGWILYAFWEGGKALVGGRGWRVGWYLLSILLTPLGVCICVIGCGGLLGGVVCLSFLGTLIQWAVYWSTRVVYGMVRVGVSYVWAKAGRKKRRKEEAAVAIAFGGGLLPTEMEFALASWNGYGGGEVGKGWLENVVVKLGVWEKTVEWSGMSEEGQERMLERLGLDDGVRSARRRKLSTYYALAMLCHLQVESGGEAWRLEETREMTDIEFEQRVGKVGDVAREAAGAVEELAARLNATSRYRLVPTGEGRVVNVRVWLRNVLLAFLETPRHCEEKEEQQR